jgi:hypothetical protein
MTDTPTAHTKRIAALNDAFRASLGAATLNGRRLGNVTMTAGIAALPFDLQLAVMRRVRGFDAFTEDNDPYGEHDFGAFDQPGAGKIFWKIDYYAPGMQRGSEDPADPKQTVRVLTILLADEY